MQGSTRIFQQRWQQMNDYLSTFPYVKPVMAIANAGQLSFDCMSRMVSSLPVGAHAVQLDVASLTADVADSIVRLHQLIPTLDMSIRLDSKPSIVTDRIVDDLYHRIRQPVNGVNWHGWFQVPVAYLSDYSSIDASHLVVEMPKIGATENKSRYLFTYPARSVNGMVLPAMTLTPSDVMQLKRVVLGSR